jgi:NurA-like 5'-3' nuclease
MLDDLPILWFITVQGNCSHMIHVFKTSVKNKTQIKKLKPFLDSNFQHINWNFDLEDCDNILRIESKKNIGKKVISLLRSYHFDCIELE